MSVAHRQSSANEMRSYRENGLLTFSTVYSPPVTLSSQEPTPSCEIEDYDHSKQIKLTFRQRKNSQLDHPLTPPFNTCAYFVRSKESSLATIPFLWATGQQIYPLTHSHTSSTHYGIYYFQTHPSKETAERHKGDRQDRQAPTGHPKHVKPAQD